MQSQFFQTYFRGLIERCVSITIELKNGLQIQGQITYVDDNLNFNIVDPEVSDPLKQPQLITLRNSFIRGSTVKYVHIPQEELQEEVLIHLIYTYIQYLFNLMQIVSCNQYNNENEKKMRNTTISACKNEVKKQKQ